MLLACIAPASSLVSPRPSLAAAPVRAVAPRAPDALMVVQTFEAQFDPAQLAVLSAVVAAPFGYWCSTSEPNAGPADLSTPIMLALHHACAADRLSSR